jgi:8-oxo-dGTP pyrophosphatase MutT (NUDIX family)
MAAIKQRRLACGVMCTALWRACKTPEVLLQVKRKYNQWEFPGGKLDGTETTKACARRELQEEVGLVATHVYQLGYVDLRDVFGCVMFHVPMHLMPGQTPTILEPEKHSMLGWFPIDKLPPNMTQDARTSLETIGLGSVSRYYGVHVTQQ